MATHSNIPAWKVPRAEEPGGLTVYGAAKKAWHDLLETSASPAAAKTFPSWVSTDKINPQVQWLFSPLSLSFVESKNGDLILL